MLKCFINQCYGRDDKGGVTRGELKCCIWEVVGLPSLEILFSIQYILFQVTLCCNSNEATLTTLHSREKKSILKVSQAAVRGAGEGYQVDLVTFLKIYSLVNKWRVHQNIVWFKLNKMETKVTFSLDLTLRETTYLSIAAGLLMTKKKTVRKRWELTCKRSSRRKMPSPSRNWSSLMVAPTIQHQMAPKVASIIRWCPKPLNNFLGLVLRYLRIESTPFSPNNSWW